MMMNKMTCSREKVLLTMTMPKRKRPADGEDEGLLANSSVNEGRPKRRRNDTTLVDTIQYMFDALRNKKKEDDTYLCEAFLRVPKKKTEPQYYDVIKKPIDMLKIQQKIKTDVYNEIEEFCIDVQLLVENAKLYYAKSTEEYKDACELWEIFIVAKEKAPDEINKEKLRQQQNQESEEEVGKTGKRRGRPPKASVASSAPMILEEDGTPMTTQDAIEELFGAIVTASDDEGRIFSYDFQLLPAPEKYPKYYQVIQQPIDLKTIALHIQDCHYENLDSVERDLNLMFDNACAFNEPGSRIYRDARTLKSLTHIRKQDLLHVLNAKKSVRLSYEVATSFRCKKAPDGKKWSELVANLQEGEILPLATEDGQIDLSVSMTTHDDDESDDEVDQDNPLWQLFLSAKNLTAPNDPNYLLCEPFRRLPNRRWHSDYYQEIKNPISMSQIRKKILKGEYHFISEMVEDFNLMLDNAQQYNRPDSRIFRDSVKLQKFIQTKSEELASLEEDVQDSDSDTDDTDSQMEARNRKPHQSRPWTFKRRAKLLFKTLMDFMTDDGRQPIVAFIEKPFRKDYPDYYEIINEPIDMEMIEQKIKGDQYANDEDLISDFRLMFRNCQAYNEEGSQIYQDANILEKVLNDKLGELQYGGDLTLGRTKCLKKNKYSHYLNMTKNIKLLYSAIRDYKDKDGRQLSEVFLKLPSKTLYPDYYEVIKQPLDLERVLHKWKSGSYSSLDDIMTDLTLMFQNACRYNEPESQIYRDGLTLQRLSLQKRLELSSREECVPNVGGLVQEMLMSLFISVFNHENAEGRYTAESFADLPDYEEIDGQKSRALSFDIMKRRLDKGLYTRLDVFQEDLFVIFDRARRLSNGNSRIYADSITLQKEYMKVRDELTGNGNLLKSRALNLKEETLEEIFRKSNLKTTITKECDIMEDTNDTITEDEDSKASIPTSDGMNNSCVSHNEVQYYVGDFVYLTPPEKNCDYPVMHIQRLWTNNSGQQMLYGCQYYRPAETFHLPTRKFFEQEVFKTEKHMGLPLSEVVGKCVVLSAIDFPKLRVDSFDEKDVYVCESRYSTKNRFFKKIKVWPFSLPHGIKITERPEPIDIKRVGSIFKERIDKHKEELAELEEETKVIRPPLPNVLKSQDTDVKGNTFYQQYNILLGSLKLGDFVYVRSGGMKAIRHIVRIWVTSEGGVFMSGTRYVRAQDVPIIGDRKPYKQEVYLTSTQETLPVSEVIGRCSVLHLKEYITQRLTEIPENDVFLCEKFFDEMNQRICTLQSGILKFSLPLEVYWNEIYYFWRPLNPQKFEFCLPSAMKKTKVEPVEVETEDSMDGRPASVASADSSLPATPKPVKKVPTGKQFQLMTGKKQMTGYILFSAEIRKSITQRNPEANFGEISRLVGIEWKRLTESERKAFEDRAHQMNLESAERAQSMLLDSPATPQVGTVASPKGAAELPVPNNPDVVFECLWESCDYMFEDLADLFDHLLAEPNGHVQKVHTVFECSWRGCSRHKKSSLAPFPMLQRLLRHVREVHILKNTGRYIQHQDRSRNFVASSRRSLLNDTKSSSPVPGFLASTPLNVGRENQYQITFGTPIQVNGVNGVTANKTGDPLFVNPPPKTQRLLHSEAYIKYIENLDKPFVSNWERQLSAAPDNAVISDNGRLPAQWLSNGVGNHGSVVNALWALREYMMKDSLGIAKIL